MLSSVLVDALQTLVTVSEQYRGCRKKIFSLGNVVLSLDRERKVNACGFGSGLGANRSGVFFFCT